MSSDIISRNAISFKVLTKVIFATFSPATTYLKNATELLIMKQDRTEIQKILFFCTRNVTENVIRILPTQPLQRTFIYDLCLSSCKNTRKKFDTINLLYIYISYIIPLNALSIKILFTILLTLDTNLWLCFYKVLSVKNPV